MKKTVYKKGDAQIGRFAVSDPEPLLRPAARQVSTAGAKRTASAVGAMRPPAAERRPPKKHKAAKAFGAVVLAVGLAAAAVAAVIVLHEVLQEKETIPAQAESWAASASEPELLPAESEPADSIPAAASEAGSEAASIPEEEPAAEPTSADYIRNAAACDLTQFPALAAALAGSENAAFLALDLTGGQTLAWQPDASLYIASAVKAPYMWYVCRQLDAGALQEDELIVYEEKFYDEGAGTIKDSEPGTVYQLSYLMQQALLRSDNIAYRLVVNRCGKDGFNALMDSVGITEGLHFTATNIWPKATARELALAWNGILDYIQSDAPHSEFLAQLLKSSIYSPIRRALGSRTVASKYGWDETSYVDAGIVYAEDGQPQYLLAILTENGNREDGGALNATAAIVQQIDAIIAPTQ